MRGLLSTTQVAKSLLRKEEVSRTYKKRQFEHREGRGRDGPAHSM